MSEPNARPRCSSPWATTPTGSHPSAYAALCGVSPIDASQADNNDTASTEVETVKPPLHSTASSCPPRRDPTTRAYMDRRIKQGKTRKEVIRCLKRYIAREIHRAILTDLAPPTKQPNPATAIAA